MSGHLNRSPKIKRIFRRRTYTTGQIANICDVASRTVSMWIDKGKLNGYRIPGSEDRRVPHKVLVKWMRDNGLPIPPEIDAPHVLLGGFDRLDSLMVYTVKFKTREHVVVNGDDPFRCGVLAAAHMPVAAILALPVLGASTCRVIRDHLKAEGCVVAAYTTFDDVGRESLLEEGYDLAISYADEADEAVANVLKVIESRRE